MNLKSRWEMRKLWVTVYNSSCLHKQNHQSINTLTFSNIMSITVIIASLNVGGFGKSSSKWLFSNQVILMALYHINNHIAVLCIQEIWFRPGDLNNDIQLFLSIRIVSDGLTLIEKNQKQIRTITKELVELKY